MVKRVIFFGKINISGFIEMNCKPYARWGRGGEGYPMPVMGRDVQIIFAGASLKID
jgi:hypothetical protein